jgi:virginiamycin B lyase
VGLRVDLYREPPDGTRHLNLHLTHMPLRLTPALLLLLILTATACARRPAPAAPRLPELSEIRELVIPWENAYPNDIVVDSTGVVWFTDRLTHAIGQFDPASEEFTRIPTPTPLTAPYGMLLAPDGGVWFAASRRGLLGRVDPATSQITEHVIPDAEGGPHLIAWHDGEVWFTLRERRGYGRFNPRTGASTVYRLENDRPYSVASTPTGVWMSSYGTSRLLQVDPQTGAVNIHDLATAPYDNGVGTDDDAARRARMQRVRPGQPHRLAVDPSGTVWASDFTRSRVIRYDVHAGSVRGWESLEQRTEPYGIVITRSGLVIYAEKNENRVVVLDPVLGGRVRARVPTPNGTIRNIAVDERRGRIFLPMSDTGRLGLLLMR